MNWIWLARVLSANYLDAKIGFRENDNYLPGVMKRERTPSIMHYRILGCYCHL